MLPPECVTEDTFCPCPFRPQYHTVSKVDAAATARGICARALDTGGLLEMDQGLPFGVPASVMRERNAIQRPPPPQPRQPPIGGSGSRRVDNQFCRCTPDQLGTTRLNVLVLGPSHGVNVYAGLATPAINPNGIHTLEAPTRPYRPGGHELGRPHRGLWAFTVRGMAEFLKAHVAVGGWEHAELFVPVRRRDGGAGRGLGDRWRQRCSQ
jgi:hypothetical protein